MQRKWEAMYYLRKVLGFPVFALCLAVPSLASADTIVTTQTYVTDYAVKQHNWGNDDKGKVLAVNSSGNVVPTSMTGLPSGSANQVLQYSNNAWTATTMDSDPTASSNKPVTSGGVKTALDDKQAKAGTDANSKYRLVNGSGTWTKLGETLDTTDQQNYVAGNAVTAGTIVTALGNKQTKPASVANGKVLMYNGADANQNVTADYVKIPNSDPSSGTAPTTFSYIWLQ